MKPREQKNDSFSPIRLKKRLGQHILKDKAILGEIAEACDIREDTTILEIGAGVANLTEALAKRAQKVIAVEIDPRFRLYHVRLLTRHPNIEFLYENIMDLKLEAMEELSHTEDLVIAGNIPYQITSPLVMKILESGLGWRRMVLMVQKELAMRLTAPPGGKETSAISLKIRYFCETSVLRTVKSQAFRPPPRVDSAIAIFTPREEQPFSVERRREFFRLLEGAFSQRRKTILNSLGHALAGGVSRKQLAEELESVGIDPGLRAENITLEQYYGLFERLGQNV